MPSSLQPIIFSGPGSNLYPLCDASSSSASACKALLPVANRPLIAYALQNLLSTGLTSCLLLAPASQHPAIIKALQGVRLTPPAALPVPGEKRKAKEVKDEKKWIGVSIVDGNGGTSSASGGGGGGSSSTSNAHQSSTSDATNMKVEILPLGPYDGKNSEEAKQQDGFRRQILGTAELLRWVASLGKLEADPLVVPVDLISPSMPLKDLVHLYTEAQASFAGTPTACCALYERGAGDGTGRERERDGPPRMLSAYSADKSDERRLLLVQDADISADVTFRRSLLQACPLMRLSTRLLDSHAYILNRDQILPLLEENPSLTSLREHVLPLVAKASWMNGLKEKANWNFDKSDGLDEDDMDGDNEGDTAKARLTQLAKSDSLTKHTLERSSTQRHNTRNAGQSKIRCLTTVSRLQAAEDDAEGSNSSLPRFIARANTVPTFLESNRWMLKALSSQSPPPFSIPSISNEHLDGAAPATTQSKDETLQSSSAQLSPDSLIGFGTKIGDRASIKRSVVGNRCEIAGGARLSGCVLMDGCRVLEK